MDGGERIGPIRLPDEEGGTVDGMLGARTPGRRDEPHRRRVPKAKRGRSVLRAEGEPCLARREADRAVTASVDEWPERGRQVERAAQVEPALDHRRIERRSGVGPDWAASNSDRLRRPRYPSATAI